MKAKIILFAFLVFIIASVVAADCVVRASSADCTANGEVAIFDVSNPTNAHASLNVDEAGYDTVCCPDSFTGNNCTGTNSVNFLDLSAVTNAHAEQDGGAGGYGIDLCLDADKTVDCTYVNAPAVCDDLLGYMGVISISGATNAHVEEYPSATYPIHVCCAVGVEGDVWAVEVSTNQGAYYLDKTPLPSDFIIATVKVTNNSNSTKTAPLTIKLVDSGGNDVGAPFLINDNVTVDGKGSFVETAYAGAGVWDVTTANGIATGTYSVVAMVPQFTNPILGDETTLGNNTSSAFITVINTPMQVSVPELPIFTIPIIAAGVLLVLAFAGKAKILKPGK